MTPPGWCEALLADVVRGFEAGRNLKAEGVPAREGEFGVLKISAVTWGEFRPDENKALLPGDEPKPHELVRSGDLLITRANTTELVGAVVLVERSHPNLMLPDKILRIVPVDRGVDARFLLFCLRSSIVRRHFEANATGTSDSMRNLSQPKMLAAPVSLPPLPEQRRIVAKIEALHDRSRAAREALEAIPPLLDRFRQSVLTAAFRGNLTADWRAKNPNVEPASVLLDRIRTERRHRWEQDQLAKMKAKGKPPKDDTWKSKYHAPAPVDPEGLPNLPEGWCWASAGELLIGIEAGRSPRAEGRPAARNEYGVLKVSAVSWGQFRPAENKALLSGQVPTPGTTVKAGDLLISRANTVELVGAVVLVDDDHPNLMLSDKTLRLLANETVVRKAYLLFALRSRWVRREFEADATGTSDSMRNLSHKKISSAPIPVPPLQEQDQIVSRVQEAALLRRSARSISDQCQARLPRLDQSILAKAFRGELVPQDPNDEPASVLLERIRAERAAATPQSGKRGKKTRKPKASPPPADADPAPPPAPAATSRGTPRPTPESAPPPSTPHGRGAADSTAAAPIPAFLDLDPADQLDQVFEALLGAGVLDRDTAIRHAAHRLRETGAANFQRLRKDSALYHAIDRALKTALAKTYFDRPRRGHLRATLPAASQYEPDDWRTCLLASLNGTPTPAPEALRTAATWAATHMGLEFTRLPTNGTILRGLEAALAHALHTGEVQSLGGRLITCRALRFDSSDIRLDRPSQT